MSPAKKIVERFCVALWPLKTFPVFLLGTESVVGGGGWMAIVVVVCAKICVKMCGKMCGKIEKLLDQNKIWCGIRYGPCDYDSGDKKT